LKACEGSLMRLRTDRLKLRRLHWVSRHPIEKTMRAMDKLIERKLIRLAGVSDIDVEDLDAADKPSETGIACDQGRITMSSVAQRGVAGSALQPETEEVR
jgi:diketogulonate reductase-like aldo/keto reductase